MNNSNPPKTAGITLVETVLYLALLSVICVVSMPLLIDQNIWQSKQNSFSDTTRDYLFIAGKVQNLVRENRMDELDDFDPALFLGTSTRVSRVSNVLFSQQNRGGFEVLDFSISINEQNFGTTTFLMGREN